MGFKCVSLSDDLFADHFPGHPVMPGALIIEAMAQLGGVLVEATTRQQGHENLHALLTMVDRGRFRKSVHPGDRLELEAQGLRCDEDAARVKVVARLEGEVAAEAELAYVFTKVTHPTLLARRAEALAVWLGGSLEGT